MSSAERVDDTKSSLKRKTISKLCEHFDDNEFIMNYIGHFVNQKSTRIAIRLDDYSEKLNASECMASLLFRWLRLLERTNCSKFECEVIIWVWGWTAHGTRLESHRKQMHTQFDIIMICERYLRTVFFVSGKTTVSQ